MFSFVEIQQSNQQVGLKDYRLEQSKVHCVYIARTPLVFAPFLPYPSCPSLPSAFQAVFPGTPYFLTLSCKRCKNWQAPHLEKRVTRSMISYFTICFGIQTCKYRFTLIAHDCLQVALLSKYNFT